MKEIPEVYKMKNETKHEEPACDYPVTKTGLIKSIDWGFFIELC